MNEQQVMKALNDLYSISRMALVNGEVSDAREGSAKIIKDALQEASVIKAELDELKAK